MRTQVIFTVLLAAILGLGGIFFLKKSTHPPTPAMEIPIKVPTAEPIVMPKPEPAPAPATVSAPAPALPLPIPAETSRVATNAPAEHVDPAVKAKLEHLEELQLNYDKESLVEILTELENPNPLIRRAAIEAAAQFRDRAAIPILKEMAGRATDPEEKQQLLQAIDYLALPTYTEVREAKKQMREEQSAQP